MTTRIRLATLCLAALLGPALSASAGSGVDPQTRDAFRTIEVLAERTWKHCRRAENSLRKTGVTEEAATAFGEAVRADFDAAWRQYEAFLATLDEDRRATVSVHAHRIEIVRKRLLRHFAAVRTATDAEPLHERAVRSAFDGITDAMVDWRRYLRQMERWLRV